MEDQTKASNVKPADGTRKFRRIITGHDGDTAVFIEDQICPNRFVIGGNPDFVVTEMWKIEQTPDDNTGDGADPSKQFTFVPPQQGNIFRILEVAPDSSMGLTPDGNTIPPLMHRTASTDYAYIIDGEVYANLDGEEKLMKAGDVLIQRGTIHAWSNRSNKPCIILFVLCGAKELHGLATM